MKAELKKGDLVIPLDELVASLTHEQKIELAKIEGFEMAMANTLADMITEDGTVDGWWVGTSGGTGPLHKAREAILEKMSKVEHHAVKELMIALQRETADATRARRWAWDLYRWIQNDHNRVCRECGERQAWRPPELPDWVHQDWPTDAQVQEVIKRGCPIIPGPATD